MLALVLAAAANAQGPATPERPPFGPGILDPNFPVQPPAPRDQRPAVVASDEERFALANDLAWSGRYDPAVERYRALFGTPYDSRARLGIANVTRWRGRADLAEPIYAEVLRREPANEEARGGLAAGSRELRPALTGRIARAADNQDMSRNELGVSYRRWTADRRWRYEVGVQGERNDSAQRDWSARSLHGSAWGTQLPLAPRLDASLYDSSIGEARLFGMLQVEPVLHRLRVRVGRVNWERLAFNPAAQGLTARTLGALGEADVGVGVLRGRLDGFDISDGNRIVDGEVQLTPAWQPLPARLVWFGGVYGRDSEREDPRYWSPRPTYGLAFIGLQRGWYFDRSDFTVSVRRGFGFTDSARNSWSAGANGRRWLTNDLALGLEAWAVNAPRPTPYRMHQLTAFVQQLW